ncbi:MAG: DUF222 domain-containing protein [Marmoricola sp.]
MIPGAVAVAQAAVVDAAAAPVFGLDDDQLGSVVAEVAGLESAVMALKLSLLAEADRREVAQREADADTGAWAARLTGSSRAVLAGGIWLAKLLQSRYDATRRAFALGEVNQDQAMVIVTVCERFPAQVSEQQRVAAEEALVAKATGTSHRRGKRMDARRLRIAAKRVLRGLVPPEQAEAHEGDQQKKEEQRAHHESWLALHDNGDGTFSGRFQVPELQGQILRTILERLSSPRRWARVEDTAVEDPTVADVVGSCSGLSWSERMGAAFVELLEHLPTDGYGRATSASVVVHLDFAHLLGGLDAAGVAGMDTGATVSAGEARRLACKAGIIPMVLGGQSQPLNLGRLQRLFTTAHRVTLSNQYDTCGIDTCERPFAWCELHHKVAWSRGGRTDLKNAIPLCGFHHRQAHDSRYDLTYHLDGTARFHRRR